MNNKHSSLLLLIFTVHLFFLSSCCSTSRPFYCVEGADNNGKAWNILFPANTTVTTSNLKILDESVVALEAKVPVITMSADNTSLQTEVKKITAIPYYTWCNRGSNQMQVWLPVRINDVKLNY